MSLVAGWIAAKIATAAPAKVVIYPPEYWNEPTLDLHYVSATDASVDEAGAKKYKKAATAPLNYVTDVQNDLITLGYLKAGSADGAYGPGAKRAVTRFQRHAKRLYRMVGATKAAADVGAGDVFTGTVDGVVKEATAKEIRKWIDKGWVNPVGRFKTQTLTIDPAQKLREDAATEWDTIVTNVTAAGGTLGGTYGDTLRPLRKTSKAGTSGYSFHYCGRAVDIAQDHTLSKGFDGNGRRYWVCKDASGTDMYWKIWCKCDKQDGTQGTKLAKNSTKYWSFGESMERNIPEGYYMDLTAEIQSSGKFERIKSQTGWESSYNKSEWWHFQYNVDKQETFSDELELIGFSEADIRAAGWKTDAELDHKPG